MVTTVFTFYSPKKVNGDRPSATTSFSLEDDEFQTKRNSNCDLVPTLSRFKEAKGKIHLQQVVGAVRDIDGADELLSESSVLIERA